MMKTDWMFEPDSRHFVLEDYEAALARWCPGCGDHAVLNAVQKLCRDEQLPPEQTVMVSGIGCSSRFPHYMKTYGFHGLHGRALPVACGVRSRRPELNIFVSTGDGDCCSIGTAHWIHALRYNMNMVVMMFDNRVYGLTKNQTSPTSPKGESSNTHPQGAFLSPLNPISVCMSITNAYFVAQTVDWNPVHLYETIRAGFEHQGLAFIRIFQRCPHFTDHAFKEFKDEPEKVLLMTHERGIPVNDTVKRVFTNSMQHDPADIDQAHKLARRDDVLPIGLFLRNDQSERYDEYTKRGVNMSNGEKLSALNRELDRFAI